MAGEAGCHGHADLGGRPGRRELFCIPGHQLSHHCWGPLRAPGSSGPPAAELAAPQVLVPGEMPCPAAVHPDLFPAGCSAVGILYPATTLTALGMLLKGLLTSHIIRFCLEMTTVTANMEMLCQAPQHMQLADMCRTVAAYRRCVNLHCCCVVCQVTSHPLLWSALADGRGATAVVVQAQLGRPALSFLWDHTVQGRAILPGSAMCEMAVAAGKVCPSSWSNSHTKEVHGTFC